MRPLLAATVIAALAASPAARAEEPAWKNQALPVEARVADLIARMTLDEKALQMKDVAPAIPRLGLPEYNWWNEALHGVARSGLATSFPQAIGLAATWDDALMRAIATAISDEARAKHHEYLRRGSRQRYQGLTFWSPNINIFRDPRWGRGQETYGEDPFLTGQLAVQFVRGLQGDDPKYFKTVATVKHFAVHSGPEPERHAFDAVVGARDLRETYLPHFQRAIEEGGAYSLMCAYNRVDGKAACGSDMLIANILRGEWKFPGYVVSDCGAMDDIYLRHQLVATAPAAAALGIKTGTDLDCGRVVYPSLVEAVKQGLITEREVDVSLARLLTARFKLGMFDDQAGVRWSNIPLSVVDQPAHRELARRAARESIVLLKNQGSLLPLRKDLGTLAVIGPNADQPRMLLGNYAGNPRDPVTPLRGIREAVSDRTTVLHAIGSELATGFPVLERVPTAVLATPDGKPGLRVDYFRSTRIDGGPLASGVDPTIDADWKDGAPRAGMNADNFGVRWMGTITPPRTGAYRLALVGTVQFELWLDGKPILRSAYPTHDGEFPDPRTVQSAPLVLEGGRRYRLEVDGRESYGEAALQMLWSPPHDDLAAEAVEVARKADAVVLVLGLTARLEGEEMRVEVEGFHGGDRTSIDLPAPQERLLERVMAVGKPTVLVLMSGSALAVGWADEHVPAILEAWYPGQAGNAIADVLFGDYDPAGRLPVTFYRGDKDLPPFDDYRMAGRTYRFFGGKPLYPFGHGLSYTTFSYGDLRTSAATLAKDGGAVSVSVRVKNTGRVAGDEVVQLYTAHVGSKVPRARRDLRGYQRVTLSPGEAREVSFTVPARALAYWDEQAGRWQVEADRVRLEVGPSSGDVKLAKTIRVR